MRILFCNYEYPPLGGGGGVINALLAEELAKRHEVAVLTSQGMGLKRDEDRNGVRVLRVPVFFRNQISAANIPSMLAYLPMGINRGRKLLGQSQFDVINTHFVLPTGPVGDILARYSGLPHILSVHGGDLYDPSKWTSPHRHWLLRAWVRRLLLRADCVVGQSRNTLDNVVRYYDRTIETVRIPLGIRRPHFEPASRHEHGFEEGDVLFATVGRLVARKATDQLIKLIGALRGKPHLLIMGTGPQEPVLRKLAVEHGVQDRVHFLGFVDEADKFRILQMCDAFVSTSQHEGFGLVFLEAMASGLPVVCYDHGGQTDFLESGVTGYMLPLNDMSAVAAACQELLDHPERRKVMGAENRLRVESLYIDNCAAQYEELFRSAIDASRKTGHANPYRP